MTDNKIWNIKNRNDLLEQIVDGIKSLQFLPMWQIEVIFCRGNEILTRCDLLTALDYIARDLYFDENSNWQNADVIKMRTL